jgi:hypothetical protein
MGVLYVIGKVCIFAAGAAGKAAGVEEDEANANGPLAANVGPRQRTQETFFFCLKLLFHSADIRCPIFGLKAHGLQAMTCNSHEPVFPTAHLHPITYHIRRARQKPPGALGTWDWDFVHFSDASQRLGLAVSAKAQVFSCPLGVFAGLHSCPLTIEKPNLEVHK